MTSCMISLSRSGGWSATSLLSLPSSSSGCFNRYISVANRPSHFFFQLKEVAWLIHARP
jgi:hypothetical protein